MARLASAGRPSIRRYKLLLTHSDRQTLLGQLHEDEFLPPDPSPRLVENFNYFCRKVRRLSTPELHALCYGLAKCCFSECFGGRRPFCTGPFR